MSGVSVIGVGMVPFGKYPDRTITDIGWPAVKQAVRDAGIDGRRIEAVYSGTARGGAMVGQRIMGRLGLAGLPIVNIENACSSSSSGSARSSRWNTVSSIVSSKTSASAAFLRSPAGSVPRPNSSSAQPISSARSTRNPARFSLPTQTITCSRM